MASGEPHARKIGMLSVMPATICQMPSGLATQRVEIRKRTNAPSSRSPQIATAIGARRRTRFIFAQMLPNVRVERA